MNAVTPKVRRELLSMAARRIARQRLEPGTRRTPEEIVRWSGAVQAQDYPLACWSVGQRTGGATCASVTAAVAAGDVLRTHVLRPTWHFVAREDLRWMLALTGARVKARLVPFDSRGGLDPETVRRGVKAVTAVFRDGGHRTREEVASALKASQSLQLSGWALGHVLMHAELDGVLCSGRPKGSKQTHALLDERAPSLDYPTGDEALALLARRYFQSHAPATERDFRWWSGLPAAASRRAIAALAPEATTVRVADLEFVEWRDPVAGGSPGAHLLQPFDELVVAYSESRALLDLAGAVADRKPEGLLSRTVLVDSQVVGRWRRASAPQSFAVSVEMPSLPAVRVKRALEAAAARHADFFGRRLEETAFTTA